MRAETSIRRGGGAGTRSSKDAPRVLGQQAQRAAHAGGEIARDGEAEAGAAGAFIDAAVEPLEGAEDALRSRGGNARALVGDGDRERAVGERAGDFDFAAGDVFFHVGKQVARGSARGRRHRAGRRRATSPVQRTSSARRAKDGANCSTTAAITLAGTQARGSARSLPCSWREKVSTLSISRPSRRASSCTSASRRVASRGASSSASVARSMLSRIFVSGVRSSWETRLTKETRCAASAAARRCWPKTMTPSKATSTASAPLAASVAVS